MVKKELTLRERRKIYEDTIYVVSQTQKISTVSRGIQNDRTVQNMIEKQTDRCVSILTTVLGYHETVVVGDDNTKTTMLMPTDDDSAYAIEKKKFEEIVQLLPNNKELKESLWKAFVKRDKKATDKFNTWVA